MGEGHLYPLQCLDANTAKLKVTVDGGTNELYNNTEDERDKYIPHLITGDFDSVQPNVLQYYKEKNVEILETPDQDYTDFTKCLQVLANRKLTTQGKHILHTSSPCRHDWCGLIPIGSSCECVTTSGLKWNLDKQRLRFGELISTSNTWDNDSGFVTIETDQPLLWTMGIKLPS